MNKFGRRIHRYESVSSTNDLARALADKGEPEGTVVLADEQKRGRGKWRRVWISPQGEGIWMSLILRPKLKPEDTAKITLMTAVAIVKALDKQLGIKARIKWPNDILVKGKKIAGILTEMKTEKAKVKFVIVGIGVNTNIDFSKFPEELRGGITSVKKEYLRQFSPERLMKEILREMEFCYSLFREEGFSPIREEWKGYSATLGKQIEARYHGEKVFGQAVGLGETGTLLLRRDSGIIDELSGSDIHIVDSTH